ncbi:MAG: hypothetical protein ACAI44_33275, partial [Candidatus Sericytochromatia bacterium]
ASPGITQLTSTTELGQLGDLIFTQMGLPVYKVGKSTATTLKQKLGITSFFSVHQVSRFLLVPATRSSTGGLTFTSSGTNWVAVCSNFGGGFYIYDPGAGNLSGNGFYSISDVAPALETALYNYTGTLIGVDAN